MATSRTRSTGTLLAQIRVSAEPLDDRAALYRDGDSHAAMFSAFPASYWRRWTTLDGVVLRTVTRGTGRLVVSASDAEGVSRVVEVRELEGTADTVLELPLGDADGGWLWFDLEPAGELELVDAGWWSPAGAEPPRTIRATLGITTLNREDYLIPLLARIADHETTASVIDRIVVTDHGSRRVVDAAGYPEVKAALGDRLEVLEQANLGGSGGFARGMLETLARGGDAVILLDDDVELDPESLRRLVRFAEFATVPTIVGGHMFDMAHKSRLHAFSEGIRWRKFFWETNGEPRHDLASSNLRSTPWLHRRADADYNGWWMCLIPAQVLRERGLAMPFFIKWDDAEYGVRAGAAGTPTVTLPGAGVWHVSWENKDDTVDWQGYFHARNRLVAALLHSPYPDGGSVVRANFDISVKQLLALEYGAAKLRIEAFRDVLSGPAGLHGDLGSKIGAARRILAETPTVAALDAAGWAERAAGVADSPLHAAPHEQPGPARFLREVARLGLRNLRRTPRPQDGAQARLTTVDARWWNVGRYDSVLVTNADGSGGRWLRRDRAEFFRLLRETRRLTRELRRQWPTLAAAYRAALPDLVSVDAWRATTGISGPSAR